MKQDYAERRKYIRLNSCFPVEFSFFFPAGTILTKEYQGFTRDISEGGMCLDAKNLSDEDSELVSRKWPRLSLTIDIPVLGHLVKTRVKVMWVKKDESDQGKHNYFIGVSYLDINSRDKRKIINYARRLKYLPRLAVALLLLMFLGIAVLSFYHIQARKDNKVLVDQLVSVSEVKSDLEKRLNELKTRKEMLESKLVKSAENAIGLKQGITDIEKRLTDEKKRLEQKLASARDQQRDLENKMSDLSADEITSGEMAYKVTESRLTGLNATIELLKIELSEVAKKADLEKQVLNDNLDSLRQDNVTLQGEIELTQKGEILLEEQLAQVRLKSGEIAQASIDKMLKWLMVHQTKKTGLVLSYEGDKALKDWGFTYDQALVCQAFLILGERERAEDILEFFLNRAQRLSGLFYNAYDVKIGTPCESIVHSGPNMWIAIAACQYTHRIGDDKFLSIAKEIAQDMMVMQRSSLDGSIKGGPDTDWVSTEHNLDAYALFNMLYDLTVEDEYKQAASAALAWLESAGYNKQEGRFLRGKGDATIATDTFSWAIAAIGPATLSENNMDPDGIMEFAEKECRVEAKFYRPEGRTIDVTGFDFAKAQNIGRGGIVSTEWTAQMIVAFKIMADYYRDKGDIEKESIYKLKAEYYLSQLGKMVVSSPSPTGQGEGCLPYASMDNVKTGHGWRVANGRRTGSVSGTAYYIFAYEDYNPLKF